MVDRITGASFDKLGGSSPSGTIQTSEFAGYIDALYGLCAENSGNPFSDLLHGGDTSDPRMISALRTFMLTMGNSDFRTALQAEYAAETAQGATPCPLFMSLYNLLNQPGAFSQGGTSYSVLAFAQKYRNDYPNLWNNHTADMNTMLNSLNLGSTFYQVIHNIGQDPSAGGWSGNLVKAYQKNDDINTAIGYYADFVKDMNNGDDESALRAMEAFINAGSVSDVASDPNYQVLRALLDDEQANIGGNPSGCIYDSTGQPLKDASGKPLQAYTFGELATIYENFVNGQPGLQAKDLGSFNSYVMGLFLHTVGNPSTSAKGDTWQDVFNSLMSYYTGPY